MKILGRAAAVFTAAFFLSSPAWALFELTVESRKGGRDLRFDAGLSVPGVREEELVLTVETDQAVPYRILSMVLSPLTNEQGQTLDQGSLYYFSPTNPLGDLRVKLETPVSMGQTLLYVSNAAGDSDQLTFVFHLNMPPDAPGGVYRASMSFTLEPVTPVSGLMPRTVTIQLRAEAKPAFRMSVRSSRGSERLDLGRISAKNLPQPAVLEFTIESNIGQPYRIFQELRSPLTSEAGQVLGEEAISFSTEGATGGRTASSGKLSSSPELLFESDAAGNPAQFRAVYGVESPLQLAAGRMNGALFFRVESASPYAANQSAQLPVLLEVEPMFNLDLEIPDGFGLQFGNLKAGDEIPEKRVFIKVQSNMRKPYQVSQIVTRKMTLPDGTALPENAFRYEVEKVPTGSTQAIGMRPVPLGESPLFLSDAVGTPETLTCVYSLTVPPTAKAGSYGTEIKYSITTL